jgi:hypothetical protein
MTTIAATTASAKNGHTRPGPPPTHVTRLAIAARLINSIAHLASRLSRAYGGEG